MDRSKKQNPAYALSSSDGPGSLQVNCMLNGSNYLTWVKAMRIGLNSRSKLGFIDGTIKRPSEGEPNEEEWGLVDSMIVAWIFNTMEKDLMASVNYPESAKKLWDDLRERFGQGNEARTYQIKSEICLLRQEGRSVAEYFYKLKALWDELENYLETPGCEHCDAAAKCASQREKEKVFQFLMGLNHETFGTVRSNILSTEPLPGVSKAYSLVLQEEQQRMTARSHDGGYQAAAFVARGGGGSGSDGTRGGGQSGRPICEHCGRPGHRQYSCWQLHGRPTTSEEKEKERQRKWAATKGQAQNMKNGHQGPPPPTAGRRQSAGPSAHAAQTTGTKGSGAGPSSLADLTEGQIQQLLALIGHDNANGDRLSGKNFIRVVGAWILDTGASMHMTGFANQLLDALPIAASPVLIPNGASVQATKMGRVDIGGLFHLRNVLLLPDFHCNLISVARLSKDMNCQVTFFSN